MSATCRILTTAAEDTAMFARVLDARQPASSTTLDAAAFLKWQRAQGRTPWGQTHLTHLALTDGLALLASAARFEFSGWLDGRPVPVWGLGSLLRHTSDTGDAGVRRLLEQTLASAEAAGVGVVLLFSTRGTVWPHDLGFTDMTPPEVDLTFPPTRRPGAPMLSIRAGEDLDLPQLAGMTAGPYTARFRLERDTPFIRHTMTVRRLLAGLQADGHERLEFFVTEEGMRAAAFVVLSVSDDGWRIEQCGDRDPTGARVGAILQALIARDPTVTAPRVHGWLPPGFAPPQAVATPGANSDHLVLARVLDSAAAPLGLGEAVFWIADWF